MLLELIRNINGTAEEIQSQLNAKTIEKIDSAMKTYATLANLFGPELVGQWDMNLKSIGLEWVRSLLAGAGIDFSNPYTQGMIDQLNIGGVMSDEDAARLKSVGIVRTSLWEEAGNVGEVSLEKVMAILKIKQCIEHTQQKATVLSSAINDQILPLQNQVSQILITQNQTIAQLQAMASDVDGGGNPSIPSTADIDARF